MKKYLLLLSFLWIIQVSFAQTNEFTTLSYFVDDTSKLELDLFLPSAPANEKIPLLIYVHGGGFSNGNRTAGHNLCKYLTSEGYATATITYTLYMKGRSFDCDGVLSEKVKAIQFAANQLWLATAFFIENADKYNIDINKIFIAGSSAGAETVLHAAFWDYEIMNLYDTKLPDSFKYAGLISGAGAIMDLNLIDKETIIPVMMFHGNSDVLVPYGTAAHHYCETNTPGWLMLFGSYSIFDHISSIDGTVQLITYCGGGHKYAGAHFYQDQQPVLDFINNVLAGEVFQKHTIISTGERDARSSKYKFCD